MWGKLRLGVRLSIGFGMILAIMAIISLVAILAMKRVEGISETLAHTQIPGWDLAEDVADAQYRAGYQVLTYSFDFDPKTLETGRAALAEIEQLLTAHERQTSSASDGDELRSLLTDVRPDVDAYSRAVDAAAQNVEHTIAARSAITAHARSFVEAIGAYRESQYASMYEQVRDGDTKEELAIRQDRIVAATRILDLGQQTLIEIWNAEANHSTAEARKIEQNVGELVRQTDTLIGVTRQAINLERLASVKQAVTGFQTSAVELAATAVAADQAREDRISAYKAVLSRVEAFKNESKQGALKGSEQTLQSVATTAAILIGGCLAALLLGTLITVVITRDTLRLLGGEPAAVVAIANRVAQGDFSLDIPRREGDTSSLMAAFANMVTHLKSLMRDVSLASAQVAAASEQLSATTEETRRQLDRQKSETEQVATAMNEMTATVEEVARHASAAAQSARETDKEATAGSRVVTETIESIDTLAHEVEQAGQVIARLSVDSQEIGAVLDVIRGVAEQTNLLALNAAIEAARAGEQGRGFAVVAAEVRTLASRTQASIQDIQDKIERVQRSSEGAVQVMGRGQDKAQHSVTQARRAGESLRAITGSIGSINDMNMQIASASEEQSAVAEEINRNIQAITEAADQTARGSLQIATASEELARLAALLRERIGQFRI